MSAAPESAVATRPPLSLGVVVRTWFRPLHLARCLDALARQERLPDDVVVVFRAEDAATASLLAAWPADRLPLRPIAMAVPGLIAASNAGIEACRTDVLAFIDDDTEPLPAWAGQVLDHFARDPALGGLGGRDRVHDGVRFDDRRRTRVGVLQWHGRVVGNHHLGAGPAREVHVLKGANMSFRATALAGVRFDGRLQGRGMQPHEDVAFSLAVRRQGWKIMYDPAAVVLHHAGRPDLRPYSSVGAVGDAQSCRDSAFNIVVAVWEELSPLRRIAFAVWSVLVGTGADPGLAQAIRYTPRAGVASWQRFLLTMQGKSAACRTLLGGRHPAAGSRQGVMRPRSRWT